MHPMLSKEAKHLVPLRYILHHSVCMPPPYLSVQILDFIDKAQHGQPVPTETVLRIARLFKDELTLDNIARPQLVSMCTYMGLQAYGSDTLLR